MQIHILGAESLGARSLACLVVTSHGKYLLDPGVALAPRRKGQAPHVLELAAAYLTRRCIREVAEGATVVVTHYHHDHLTPAEQHLYHWSNEAEADLLYRDRVVYAKPWTHHINRSQQRRAGAFLSRYPHVRPAEEGSVGPLIFSPPLWHGKASSPMGWVTAVAIRDGDACMVFGSDVQGLEDEALEWIASHRPDVAILAGPPIYLGILSDAEVQAAANRLGKLAQACGELVLDHHLCRGPWESFLDLVRRAAPGRMVRTAAEWQGRAPLPLENARSVLHRVLPAPRFAARLARGDRAAREELHQAVAWIELGSLPEDVRSAVSRSLQSPGLEG